MYTESQKKASKNWQLKNKDWLRIYIKSYKKRKYNKEACDIIKKHHDEMKDDPEHLTTEFIKKMVRVKCDI